ncbi:T9SS type A sorting domain-containing protein [Flavobacterium sp. IMCC34518]|uniref:T9SS type A sorting domain-containing protein n=1 Tax=Flavobacterium sp. IMCC34518 TaxID=3003623 RepID=UPI0022AC1682|nr:T9SS type A sorting domain-containing protein [Flavobacterium sp. IMCC34518]
MKIKLLLIGCFFSLIFTLNAQTTLSPGDIAIIGYNRGAVAPQEMAIVSLVNIASGTIIRITDYGYDEVTSTFGTTSTGFDSEGSIAWTTTSAIPAGTVIRFTIAGNPDGIPTVTGLTGTISITGFTSSLVNNVIPVSGSGDNWFVYQGSNPKSVSSFVFGWTNPFPSTHFGITQKIGEFLVSGSGTPSNTNSYLPPSLTLGTNAIALNISNTLVVGGLHGDNNIYTGIKSGTKAALLNAICDKANWDSNETTTYDIGPGGANFSGINPIFTVTDANSAPTDLVLSASSINENVASNSTVGTLSATDADAANTFTYTLVAGTGSTDNASFNISGSNLRITASPDFETKSSYSVRIRTTDQGALFFEKAFTITINNVNETPTDLALSASSINENVASNSTVGTLSATDVDAANTFTYTLVAGTGSTDNASFNISGGNLQITSSPDFETKSSYSVRIRTTDQGALFFEKAFTITINNVNETPTDLALSASSINENVASNSTVGTLSATDVDAANTFTYTLVAGTGSTDNASFNISGGNLQITSSPDFETKSSYSVRIRTTDQGALFFEKAFTITINNVNETPTDLALSASSINENVSSNSTVGTLSATDADAANTFTYTLVAGTGSTDNASFNISGGNLQITSSPDFETKSSYSVRIRTTDQGALFFEKAFTITINDLNETPTDIALSASAINENVSSNSIVGTLSATDVDAANTFTYTLVAGTGSTDNASFNISGSNLRITASPDFETKSSYSVRIRTTDQGSLFFEKAFTITINNVNETPTDIALSASSINENVASNSTVGTLSATDVDAANTFTYTLVAGTGSTDNASFNISGGNLQITSSPDFETKSSYSVRIRTTDQGALFFEKAFTITINNVNETPTDIALSASSINENVASNSTVGTLSATDVDAANTFNYTLVAGTGSTDNASFNISGGNLRITSSPDFETKSSYSVRIRTTDQGALFFEKAFTITINDVNESPTDIALSASSINENVAGNSTVGTLSATDADAANTFTYTLVAGTGSTDNASFNISGSNLRITASPDFETKSSYSVRVSTSDGSLTFEKQFTITINDVNETPTDIVLSASSINENVIANSTEGTLSSIDPDSGSSYTYSLVAGAGDTDNVSFSISGNDLTINSSPDFESKSSYSVLIRTTDQGGLFFEKAFTIAINDLCDLDNTVTQVSGTLTATQTGANYQWYKCSDNSPIGTNSNTFAPTQTGDYKVEITIGACMVTSNCISVTTLGIENFQTNSGILIYPNPSQGIINIKSISNSDFQVVNMLGQVLKTFKTEANVTTTIDLQNLSENIYFIKENNDSKNKTHKILIKK